MGSGDSGLPRSQPQGPVSCPAANGGKEYFLKPRAFSPPWRPLVLRGLRGAAQAGNGPTAALGAGNRCQAMSRRRSGRVRVGKRRTTLWTRPLYPDNLAGDPVRRNSRIRVVESVSLGLQPGNPVPLPSAHDSMDQDGSHGRTGHHQVPRTKGRGVSRPDRQDLSPLQEGAHASAGRGDPYRCSRCKQV